MAGGKLVVSAKWDFELPPPPMRGPRERFYRNMSLFELEEYTVFGHEQSVLNTDFRVALEKFCEPLPYALRITSPFRLIAEGHRGSSVGEVATAWKVSGDRFKHSLRQSGRWDGFVTECQVSLLKRKCLVKDVVLRLGKTWDEENAKEQFSRVACNRSIQKEPTEEPALDPLQFMVMYRGVKAKIVIKNAVNLPEGSWFDKLSAYAVVKFAGSAGPDVRTGVLRDVGGQPFWDCEGELVYNGEGALEVQVWSYSRHGADELVAHGKLSITSFYQGFDSMIRLEPYSKKSRWGRRARAMAIIIGVSWPTVSVSEGMHSKVFNEESEAFQKSGSLAGFTGFSSKTASWQAA